MRPVISTCKACREVIAYKASGGPMSARPGYWFHLLTMRPHLHDPVPSPIARIRAGIKELFD